MNNEGKEKMSFDVYQVICELLLTRGTTGSTFLNCVWILEWNLMARSDNICATQINHFTYQEGVNSNDL